MESAWVPGFASLFFFFIDSWLLSTALAPAAGLISYLLKEGEEIW